MKNHFILFTLFLLTSSIQGQKVLFVGNSLTFTNNMPLILEEIALQLGKSIKTEKICLPNYAIIDHWKDGEIQQKIATKNFDYVIIQQGPSSQEIGKKMLIEDGRKISNLCNKYNTKLGYFMVWPAKRHYFTFDKVIANHKEAAKVNNAILFKVGTNWKQYQTQKNKTPLYGSDQFHPSKAGSFFAALTILKKLFPEENLNNLSYKDVNLWVKHKASYKAMIQLLTL